jgi:hypothetical protein
MKAVVQGFTKRSSSTDSADSTNAASAVNSARRSSLRIRLFPLDARR